MATIAAKLAALLESVNRPGDFFVSGTIEMMAPRLAVDGVGTIGLPLLPIQAEQLVTAAERAPYGRGEDTVVDTKVRRTWQIGSERVRITGKHWGQTLDAILARVAGGLGIGLGLANRLLRSSTSKRRSSTVLCWIETGGPLRVRMMRPRRRGGGGEGRRWVWERRKCKCCHELFRPDPRNHRHQIHCSAAACRAASKAASQARWLAKPENQNYFRGPVHVARVQTWRSRHPGYWVGGGGGRTPPHLGRAL